MSSLMQSYEEVLIKDALNPKPLVSMAVKQSDAKFTNTVDRVGTLFLKDTYLYKLDDNINAYKYDNEFTVCFWCKFADKGKVDEAFGNKITLVLNDNTVVQTDIPSNVNMTEYHWVKIQRDSNNLITITLDNSVLTSETSSSTFSLADNSYIFVGNANRYFTGYDVICDDILIFGGVKDNLATSPNTYLNTSDFQMVLYIKVSDGSVWGYKEDT